MNKKSICLFVGSAATVFSLGVAFADDQANYESNSYEHKEVTTNNVMPPATTRTERSITTSQPAGITTTTTEETWKGRVRRVSPSEMVVAIDGNDYVVTGPKVADLGTMTGKDITIWGHLDQPQRRIEITRYERIER